MNRETNIIATATPGGIRVREKNLKRAEKSRSVKDEIAQTPMLQHTHVLHS